MTYQIDEKTQRLDISLLAIEAAEELARSQKNIPTDFKSVKILASILQESFSDNLKESGAYRLDHASVVSDAMSNSLDAAFGQKTIAEIANEAIKIADQLNPDNISSKDEEIQKLVAFCVALSDSAALYREEVDDLKKHFA